jgi:hypothetical protein
VSAPQVSQAIRGRRVDTGAGAPDNLDGRSPGSIKEDVMSWSLDGRYMETCNCDFLCPCPLTGLQRSTHGHCIFAMAFSVERGAFDGVKLDGRKFIVVGRTPGEMGQGGWKVGLIVDDQADQRQREALTSIVSGQAGGPMANLAPLLGEFLGVETRPIRFEHQGKRWAVSAGPLLEQELEEASGLGGEQLHLDGSGHPAANRLGLGNAKQSKLHAFGIDWEDSSGRNNGHHAPFAWRG